LPDTDFAGFQIDDGLLLNSYEVCLPKFECCSTNQRNRTLTSVPRLSMQLVPESDPAGPLTHAPAVLDLATSRLAQVPARSDNEGDGFRARNVPMRKVQ